MQKKIMVEWMKSFFALRTCVKKNVIDWYLKKNILQLKIFSKVSKSNAFSNASNNIKTLGQIQNCKR
jgi:predicted transport protein